jgi:hypothetical protein
MAATMQSAAIPRAQDRLRCPFKVIAKPKQACTLVPMDARRGKWLRRSDGFSRLAVIQWSLAKHDTESTGERDLQHSPQELTDFLTEPKDKNEHCDGPYRLNQ